MPGTSDEVGFVTVNRRRPNSSRALPVRTPAASPSSSVNNSSNPPPVRARAHASSIRTDSRSPPVSTQASSSGSHRKSSPGASHGVAVIGTSMVRGVGGRLNRCGMDATSFVFPGYEIPQITERISGVLSRDYQPEVVMLQCGGNDLANNRPTAQVIQQLDSLVREIKRCCPRATIVVNKIPPRGRDKRLLHNISMVNTFISNMARDSKLCVSCCDPSPKIFKYYSKDEIHLNHLGRRSDAYELAKFLTYFQWPPLANFL